MLVGCRSSGCLCLQFGSVDRRQTCAMDCRLDDCSDCMPAVWCEMHTVTFKSAVDDGACRWQLRQLAGVTEKDRVFTVWWPRGLAPACSHPRKCVVCFLTQHHKHASSADSIADRRVWFAPAQICCRGCTSVRKTRNDGGSRCKWRPHRKASWVLAQASSRHTDLALFSEP